MDVCGCTCCVERMSVHYQPHAFTYVYISAPCVYVRTYVRKRVGLKWMSVGVRVVVKWMSVGVRVVLKWMSVRVRVVLK